MDFPILAGQPVWLFLALLLIGMGITWTLNNLYFRWLRSRFPAFFYLRVLIAILILGVGVIVVGLVINPPSAVMSGKQP